MRSVAVLAILLSLVGCGYVGDPLPPAARIPAPVLDLAAVQKGADVEISFTLPEQTTEGLPITKPGTIDLRAGVFSEAPFDTNRWLAGARAVEANWTLKPADQTAPVRVTKTIPAAPWQGRDLIIGVRLSSPKGRYSGFSKLVTLTVVAPLATPAVSARASAEGVLVTWPADPRPGVRYAVRRIDAGVAEPIVLGETAESRFVDSAALFEKPYQYVVQATWKENDINAVSLPSEAAAITPVDTFPPATPTGLTALLGVTSIEVAWDRNTDSDLAGYRVYRATAPGAEFQKIADLGSTPNYSDRQFERNKTYRYAVSAYDRRGNESKRSEPFEIESR